MKVVFLGCTHNYGFGFSANVTKIGYMAKGLTEAGVDCAIHNGIIGNSFVDKEDRRTVGNIPVTSLKKRGHEVISWLFNIGRLHRYLKKERKTEGCNIAIIEMDMYHIFLLYWFLCKINKYKLVAISHEWGPTIVEVNKIRKPSIWLYSKTFGWFTDAILPISEYIIKKIEHFKKPYFKLPILAEFSNNDITYNGRRHNLVYCASVYYKRIIILIIEAFRLYNQNNGKLGLTLILNGPKDRIEDISRVVEEYGLQDRITIKSKLPYSDLIELYETAAALIIPLDPNCEQDEARFSQKIAEYLSSKSPIITNDVGEIKYYFSDDEIIKCEFKEETFADKFKWIEENPEKCREIGIKGHARGMKEFDYNKICTQMSEFLNKFNDN